MIEKITKLYMDISVFSGIYDTKDEELLGATENVQAILPSLKDDFKIII